MLENECRICSGTEELRSTSLLKIFDDDTGYTVTEIYLCQSCIEKAGMECERHGIHFFMENPEPPVELPDDKIFTTYACPGCALEKTRAMSSKQMEEYVGLLRQHFPDESEFHYGIFEATKGLSKDQLIVFELEMMARLSNSSIEKLITALISGEDRVLN